ncbi:hypothetical protein BaRGS_00039514, partial [Batillaria attramentaria]
MLCSPKRLAASSKTSQILLNASCVHHTCSSRLPTNKKVLDSLKAVTCGRVHVIFPGKQILVDKENSPECVKCRVEKEKIEERG